MTRTLTFFFISKKEKFLINITIIRVKVEINNHVMNKKRYNFIIQLYKENKII